MLFLRLWLIFSGTNLTFYNCGRLQSVIKEYLAPTLTNTRWVAAQSTFTQRNRINFCYPENCMWMILANSYLCNGGGYKEGKNQFCKFPFAPRSRGTWITIVLLTDDFHLKAFVQNEHLLWIWILIWRGSLPFIYICKLPFLVSSYTKYVLSVKLVSYIYLHK